MIDESLAGRSLTILMRRYNRITPYAITDDIVLLRSGHWDD